MRSMEKLNSVPGKPYSAKVKIKIKAERYRRLKFTKHKFCYVLFHLKTRTMKLLVKSWLWFAYFYGMSDKESLVNTNGDKEINLQQGLNGQVSQLPHSPITSTRHTHTKSIYYPYNSTSDSFAV